MWSTHEMRSIFSVRSRFQRLLTSDGRLAKADSKAVDTTVPTLLAIAKAAAGDAAAIAAKGLNYDELGLRRGTIRAITPPAFTAAWPTAVQ